MKLWGGPGASIMHVVCTARSWGAFSHVIYDANAARDFLQRDQRETSWTCGHMIYAACLRPSWLVVWEPRG